MRRHNQLLFRAARAVMGNPFDAEDVLQEAYVKALGALGRFEGRSSLATWLVRIVVNEALTRAGRARRVVPLHSVATVHDEVPDDESARASGWLGDSRRAPELAAGDRELRAVLWAAVDRLPEAARTVFTLRCVEELSVEETAECLDVSPEVVRVRLHRASRVRWKTAPTSRRCCVPGGRGALSDPRLGIDIQAAPDMVTPTLAALRAHQLSLEAHRPPAGSDDAAAAGRGERAFKGEARCSTCHTP